MLQRFLPAYESSRGTSYLEQYIPDATFEEIYKVYILGQDSRDIIPNFKSKSLIVIRLFDSK